MLILQACAKSLIILLNWIYILGKKTLIFLYHQVQQPLNGEKNLNEFELGLSIIDATMYHDFTIDEKYFCGNCIYTIGQ